MSLFSFFSFLQPKSRKPLRRQGRSTRRLEIEDLEGRLLPSCNVISGFVYHDTNYNGLFDPSETPIANSVLQLRNAANQVVATATSDAMGYYEFTHDTTLSQAVTTKVHEVAFPPTQTNFSLQAMVQQFDPSLGQLLEVKVIQDGSITSEIKVENTSPTSSSTISSNISGVLTLSGAGISLEMTLSENPSETFNAAQFDGTIDFNGPSGRSFVPRTVSGTKEATLTGSQMSPFVGTGFLTLTETAQATSWANGGGNLVMSMISSATAKVKVVYKYIPSNCLQPGNYTIVQTDQPTGFFDGQESRNGALLNNPYGTSLIPVTLDHADLINNNFAEVKGKLSGYVYVDANNNGIKDSGEMGIAGVTISLERDTPTALSQSGTTTDAQGFYQFQNLVPATYTLIESQPTEYADGQDSIGNQGGSTGVDRFFGVTLGPVVQGTNNNFGEKIIEKADLGIVKTASAGSVPLGSTLTYVLTITNLGTHAAQQVVVSDPLPPEATYISGVSPGWNVTQSNGVLTATTASLPVGATAAIAVTVEAPSVAGDITNTATVTSSTLDPNPANNTSTVTTTVYDQPGDTFPKVFTPLVTTFAVQPIISKNDLFSTPGDPYLDPRVRGLAIYVDGLYRSLLNRPVDQGALLIHLQQLNNGTMTRQQLVSALWNSDAHREQQAAAYFQIFLRRSPTAVERDWVVSLLKAGYGETEMAMRFVTSAEYQAGHPTPGALVSGVYQNILGRAPDVSTKGQLVNAMGATTVNTFTQSVLMSSESLAQIVDAGFRATLRRPPSQDEIGYWIGTIQAGQITPEGLIQRLLVSDEFFNLAVASAQ